VTAENFVLPRRLDWRNLNTLWGSLLAETLSRLGCRLAVVCPGSRSAPLTYALAQHPDIEAIPVLDERSAAFFALGLAQQTRQPIPLVCTSGSAAAHFFPALLEAAESGFPLLILTADRPPELRHCRAGQAIDQVKLYGHYPNWQAELAVPSADPAALAYLRQTLVHAWERTLYPFPGPVHLNVPFRDPLAPVADGSTAPLIHLQEDPEFEKTFFRGVVPLCTRPSFQAVRISFQAETASFWQEWRGCERGVILAGPAQPVDPQRYVEAVAHLAMALGWPVLAEGLSPLRNYASLNPYLITTYDLILQRDRPQLWPEQVIQLGSLPTSKVLRQTLAKVAPRVWRLDPRPDNGDPLHNPSTHLPFAVEEWVAGIPEAAAKPTTFLQGWLTAEAQIRAALDQAMTDLSEWFEGKVAWWLAHHLPPETPLFIANSTPVRDVEWFWPPNDRRIRPYFNRGTNGIDGILSTALGVAHCPSAPHHSRKRSAVLLTGDLAFLHDSGGLRLGQQVQGSLTILLINNQGGGIFELLPIAEAGPPFEPYFATPQAVDFALLCQAHGIPHRRVESWQELAQALDPLPAQGVRVLEILTDRKADAQRRREWFREWSELPSKP